MNAFVALSALPPWPRKACDMENSTNFLANGRLSVVFGPVSHLPAPHRRYCLSNTLCTVGSRYKRS